MEMPFKPNEGKNLTIETDWGAYARFPIKTHVVMKEDVMNDLLDQYVMQYLEEGDMIFISEKIVAITQGRALKVSDIKISRLAKFLVKFVYKSDAGIGIGAPSTMELCLRECGRIKVLFAAVVAGVCKLFGKRGVFYNILGMKARAIDGPSEYNVPPYNEYAKMAPENLSLHDALPISRKSGRRGSGYEGSRQCRDSHSGRQRLGLQRSRKKQQGHSGQVLRTAVSGQSP